MNKINRTCGMFIFNKKEELLITLPSNSEETWIVPSWSHLNNQNYLKVALRGVLELTGIDFFNYKEEYFKPLKHQVKKDEVFVPYAIFNEKSVDTFKCWANLKDGNPIVDIWEYVSIKDAMEVLYSTHKQALKTIKL